MAKTNITKNILTYTLSTALLIIASAIGYYFTIALPKVQLAKQSLEQQKFELEKSQAEKESEKDHYYKQCSKNAEEEAVDLLKSKIEIAKKSGITVPSTWKEASEKGMYLKDDYGSLYNKCLGGYGLK